MNAGILTPQQFVALTAAEPARIFGMPQKGCIAAGKDADILLWDPMAAYTIRASTQAMATDYNLFEGWQVLGNARHVFSRGIQVVRNGSFIGAAGHGRFLRRTANAGGFA